MADRVELGSVVYRIVFDTSGADDAATRVRSSFDDVGKTANQMGSSMRNIKADTKVAGSALSDVAKKAGTASTGMGQFKSALLQGLGIGTGFALVTKGIKTVTSAIKGSFDAAVRFESAFAGVRKTVEASEAEFGILAQGIRGMAKEIPLTVEELSKIGELGGQLGVGKADLLDFIDTIARIGVTTNLTQEEAATAFARIANIMDVPIAEVGKMGSVVVELGNNFATTEREIVDFATRIAGAGKLAGMQTEDIFALAAAMSSVGIEAEAGGTAIQKVFLAINDAVVGTSIRGAKSLQQFATLSGLSAEQFADQWRTDPIVAFDALVQGLSRAGDQASGIIDNLLGSEGRLKRAFLSIAGNADLLTDAIGRAKQESTELNALNEESAKRFATTESKIILTKNRLNDLGITIGDNLKGAYSKILDWIAEFLNGLNDATPYIIAFGKIITATFITLRNVIGTSLVTAILFWSAFFKDIWKNAVAIKDIIKGVAQAFATLPKFFGAVLTDISSSFAKTFKNIIEKIPGVVEGIAAIKGILNIVGKAFVSAVETVKGWAKSVVNVIISVKDKFVAFGKAAKDALAGKFEEAKNVIISAFTNIKNEAKQSSGEVGDEVTKSMGGVGDAIKAIFSKIKGSLSDVVVIDTSRTQSALGELSNAFGSVKEAGSRLGFENTSKAFEQIGRVATSAGMEIVDVWKDVGNAFKIDTRQQLLDNETKRVKKQAKEMEDAIAQALGGLAQDTKAGSGTSEVFKKQIDDLKLLGDEIDKNIDIYARIEDSYTSIEEKARRATDVQTSKWQDVFNVLTNSKASLEEVDKTYNTALEDIANQLSDLEQNHKNINSAIDEVTSSTKEYQTASANNKIVLQSYEQIKDAVQQATDKVKKLKEEIAGIDQELQSSTATFKENIAQKVAEAEKEIEKLRSRMSDSNISVDTRSDIEKQIREQQALIDSALQSNIDYTTELQKAREYANMNEVELLIAKFEEEKARLEEQKKLKEEQLQAELATLQEIKAQENTIYENQRNTILGIEAVITTAYRENMKARLTATQEFVNGSIQLYNKLAEAARAAAKAGANLSTGAIQAARFEGVDLNELKTSKEQQINNITQNVTVNAQVASNIDIKTLASQLSGYLKEDISQ